MVKGTRGGADIVRPTVLPSSAGGICLLSADISEMSPDNQDSSDVIDQTRRHRWQEISERRGSLLLHLSVFTRLRYGVHYVKLSLQVVPISLDSTRCASAVQPSLALY